MNEDTTCDVQKSSVPSFMNRDCEMARPRAGMPMQEMRPLLMQIQEMEASLVSAHKQISELQNVVERLINFTGMKF